MVTGEENSPFNILDISKSGGVTLNGYTISI